MNTKRRYITKSDRLCLRPTVKHDMVLKVKWYNDPEVNKTLVLPELLDLQKTYEWFEKQQKMNTRREWMIETPQGIPIGIVGIKDMNTNNRSGLLYIVIGEKEYWGKGLGLEAELLAIHYGFQILNLHKILGTALEHNLGSIKVIDKVGFVHEGTSRADYFQDGKFYDVHRYSIFEDEFYKKHPEYKNVETCQ